MTGPKKKPFSGLKFVILIGVVSLFADLTYEGARSITGPYLALLGANAFVVGLVSGLGELIGYALRFVSGWLADKTRRYWAITFFGYALNLLVVPALALTGSWQMAAMLMIAERTGKAIRVPARDVMLSHATKEMGHGKGFGLHEALDQIGAMLGPSLVAFIFYLRGDYRAGFAILLIPALLALAVLIIAWRLYPRPHDLENAAPVLETKGFPKVFWIYLAAVVLVAAGYADFPLIAYHFEKTASVPQLWIPIFYAVAMGVDALASLLFGYWFDRKGLSVLVFAALIAAFFAPLVFLGGFYLALGGMILWGIGMGAQESIMRAAIAQIVSFKKRGTAYGLFNAGYGIFWFLGSALMGRLYDISIPFLIAFSVLLQIASVPFFLSAGRMKQPEN
jgi:predicted MFS family arabinose efflux permease